MIPIMDMESLIRGRRALRYLDEGSNPTITAAAVAFTTVPKGTKIICLTVRTALVTFKFTDGGAAVSTSIGNDYAVGTHWLAVNEHMLRKMRAISATGTYFVTYFGVE